MASQSLPSWSTLRPAASVICLEDVGLFGFGVGVELDVEVEAVGVAAELEGLGEEMAGADGCHEWRELLRLAGRRR